MYQLFKVVNAYRSKLGESNQTTINACLVLGLAQILRSEHIDAIDNLESVIRRQTIHPFIGLAHPACLLAKQALALSILSSKEKEEKEEELLDPGGKAAGLLEEVARAREKLQGAGSTSSARIPDPDRDAGGRSGARRRLLDLVTHLNTFVRNATVRGEDGDRPADCSPGQAAGSFLSMLGGRSTLDAMILDVYGQQVDAVKPVLKVEMTIFETPPHCHTGGPGWPALHQPGEPGPAAAAGQAYGIQRGRGPLRMHGSKQGGCAGGSRRGLDGGSQHSCHGQVCLLSNSFFKMKQGFPFFFILWPN